MLIYSEDRLVPSEVNMLVIQDKEAGYYYIHRSLYDQAVIIYDIYGDNPMQLIQDITGKAESRPDVDYFLENVPVPINILGPYLLLVNGVVEDFKDMCGAIHAMSGPLNLRGMLKIPFNMRNVQPSFSLSIKEEYQLAWDNFFMLATPYEEYMNVRHSGRSSDPVSDYMGLSDTGDSGGADEEVSDENAELQAALDALYGRNDDFNNALMGLVEPEPEEEGAAEEAVEEEPEGPEEVEEEVVEEQGPVSGIDAILGM